MSEKSWSSIVKNSKPYIAMMLLQLGYAGMNIISKISLNGGMSQYVLVVYCLAFATAVMAPFAFFFERKAQPKITFVVFVQLFVLGLLVPVIDNFYYAGLKLTSPTFSCAMLNMLPALTFILAVIFRMEKVNLKEVIYQVKVAGTVITVGGAMLMTLYKGPLLDTASSKNHRPQTHPSAAAAVETSNREWVIGCILLMLATLAWASFFILQKAAEKTYSKHQLSLTSLVCFIGTLQAAFFAFFMVERDPSAWRVGWDMNLLAAAYAGIVTAGISFYVQGLVMRSKGPVFATAFSPLIMIFAAIMGFFILAEKIFLGGVIGAVIIIIGLYSVLWGKYKEEEEERMKMKLLENLDADSNKLMAKDEDDKCPSVAITLMALSDPTTKPTQ